MATAPTITRQSSDPGTGPDREPLAVTRECSTKRRAAHGARHTRRPHAFLGLVAGIARARSTTSGFALRGWPDGDQPDHQRRGWAGPTTARWW